ncbi:MAG: biopolymer transporter ExbD [Planctomycetota bacterium]
MQRSRDEVKKEVKIELTPMIDVTFLLLVFFLCLIQFKTLDAKLSTVLPKDAGTIHTPAPPPIEKIRVQLRVVGEGGTSARLGGTDRRRPVLEYRIGQTATRSFEALTARLRELHALDPTLKVVVVPEAEVLHEQVVQVVDTCVLLGLEEITFAGSKKIR